VLTKKIQQSLTALAIDGTVVTKLTALMVYYSINGVNSKHFLSTVNITVLTAVTAKRISLRFIHTEDTFKNIKMR